MRNCIVLLMLMATCLLSFSQPATDLYLFDLTKDGAQYTLQNKKQLTDGPSYNNQAMFHPDGNQIYYASVNDSGLTDIYIYDLEEEKHTQFTESFLSSEYSPTPTPDGMYVSCIRQGSDGSQDLVKYPLAGGAAEVIISNHLVGYHIWLDNEGLLTFILNKESNDLYYHDLANNEEKVLARNIGRCFQRIPGSDSFSFIQLDADGNAEIKSLDKSNLEIKSITKSIGNTQDYCWLNNGNILMAYESQLYLWDRETKWKPIVDLDKLDLSSVSRMAINADNSKIVLINSKN